MLQDMPSCDDLPSLPPTVDRCLYVREHCDAEGLIPFLKLYYCHLNASGWPFWALTLFGAAILLVVLFRVIGRTADEFFSKILSQISQDMGLPPRLGGVTLLALGNGAPDLSSSIAAVRSGNYLMALGALTGSTMFVGCVVAGKIITEHGGVKSRAAQIRDVLMQLVAVGFVTITLKSGMVTYGTVVAAILLYGMYVVIVAVADFTKRAGMEWTHICTEWGIRVFNWVEDSGLVAPLMGNRHVRTNAMAGREDNAASLPGGVPIPTVTVINPQVSFREVLRDDVGKSEDYKRSSGSSGDGGSEVEMTAPSPPRSRARSPVRVSHTLPVRDPPEELLARRSMTTGVGGLHSSGAGHHLTAREYRRRAWADMAAATYTLDRAAAAAAVAAVDEAAIIEEEEEEEAPMGTFSSDAERGEYTPPAVASLEEEEALFVPVNGYHKRDTTAVVHQAIAGPSVGTEKELEELIAEAGPLGKALEMVTTPLVLAVKGTVPIVESDAYSRGWLCLALATSPAFICWYAGSLLYTQATIMAIGCGALASGAAWIATRNVEEAPQWQLGSGYPIGAALIAVYGFAVTAMWIDVFASEIVGILHFFGLLAGINPAVLGLTVLAWGNSLTDFVANAAMARRSASGKSMAMTACYAGPLFNMLIGLGGGFWAYFADSGKTTTSVRFDPIVAVGCVFAMVNCTGVVVATVWNRLRLPRKFGLAMMFWYATYLGVVLFLVLWNAKR